MSFLGAVGAGLGNIFGKAGRERRKARRARRKGRREVAHEREMADTPQFGQGMDPETQAQLQQQAALGGERFGAAYDQMGGLSQAYGEMAQGKGPSLAQQQLAASTQSGVANQMAMASAGRGGNLAAQARQAAGAGAAGQMAGQQQAAQLRSQEQLSAMGAQGQLAGQMAGLGQQQQMGYEGMLQGAHGQQLGAETEWGLGQRGMDLERRGQNMGLGGQIVGGVASLASTAATASDERGKKNIEPGGLAATQAIGELEPKKFEYKPGFGEPGERVGIMAQALERTPAGRAIVMDTPHGKMVDDGGLAALATAATAAQEPRIKRIEKQLGLAGAKR